MKIDINKVVEIIKEATEEEILPRFKHLSASDIEEKTSPHDLVTTADKMAEKALRTKLTSYLAGSLVVGEEETFVNPDAYERLKSDKYVWVIDPVDGTGNFSKGIDDFGVIISLVKNCETIAGFIYAPIHNEMIIGELGSGAFMDGKQLHVTDTVNEADLLTIAGNNFPILRTKVKDTYWPHSAAIAYQHLVMGKANIGAFATKPIKPWDHAAGVMLHKEAGGYSALITGEQYVPYPVNGILLLTPNKERWLQLKDYVK